jgi:SAM-dependent methyltransferase
VADRVAHVEADYTRTGLPAAQADGAWAVESACYAEGTAKADFVREAARLLKPGARLVVVDGFLLRQEARPRRRLAAPPVGRQLGRAHAGHARRFHCGLARQRLRGHRVQVAALARGAPSALHIPLLATRFTLAELWKARGRLSPWRRKHIVASYCALALGMFWRDFDYCMVTARVQARATRRLISLRGAPDINRTRARCW